MTFTAASKQISGNSNMVGCTAGPPTCDVLAPVTTQTQQFSASATTTGGFSYEAVDIKLVMADSSGYSGSMSPFGFINSSLVACSNAPFHVSIPADGNLHTLWFQCRPTKSVFIPAHTFNSAGWAPDPSASNPNVIFINIDNPNGSYTDNSNRFVTSTDCNNVTGSATSKANAWEPTYTPPAITVARTNFTDGQFCSPAVGRQGTSVTGFANGHVQYQHFAVSDAQAVALARVQAATPAGWTYKSGSNSTCNPSFIAPSGGATSFAIACGDTALAYYTWGAAQKTSGAQALAGLSLSRALAKCNSSFGVQSGTCVITLTGGDGTTMPTDPNAITIVANVP